MPPHFKQKHSIDDLVHYVTLHKVNPIALRAIVWPFVVFYLICLGFIYQTDVENYEIGFIALAVVGCFHILTVLCCYWSVHIAAFLNCRKVIVCWSYDQYDQLCHEFLSSSIQFFFLNLFLGIVLLCVNLIDSIF